MTENPVLLKCDVEIDTADLVDWMRSVPRLRPAVAAVGAKYAEFIEMGTGPARQVTPRARYFIGGEGRKALDKWARLKGPGAPITNRKLRAEFVDRLIWHIYHYGMKPHPFWRPAVWYVFEHRQEFFDEGYTLDDMANEIVQRADKRVMELNLPYNGLLQQSMSHREASWDEAENLLRLNPNDRRLQDEAGRYWEKL